MIIFHIAVVIQASYMPKARAAWASEQNLSLGQPFKEPFGQHNPPFGLFDQAHIGLRPEFAV